MAMSSRRLTVMLEIRDVQMSVTQNLHQSHKFDFGVSKLLRWRHRAHYLLCTPFSRKLKPQKTSFEVGLCKLENEIFERG